MEKSETSDRIIVGISGASGAPLALRLLRMLQNTEMKVHLIVTESGWKTIELESGLSRDQVCQLADVCYPVEDITAPPSSGSWKSAGMVVIPCSMKSLAGIHSGYSDNLLLRAADVTLKEKRKLVLVTRECPMSAIHLRNQYELAMMGAVILPPVMSYYQDSKTLEDMEIQIIGKILDQFDVDCDEYYRWNGHGKEGGTD